MRKDFALCTDHNYVSFACVTITSVIASMKSDDDVHIHVLGNELKQDDVDLLKSLSNSVTVYDVGECLRSKELKVTNEWSLAAWSRFWLPDVLPVSISRVLYIDCDVIINDSLDELFKMNLTGVSVAGCLDIPSYDDSTYERLGYDRKLRYISSGVLLINLEYWREKNIKNRLIEYGIGRNLEFPDQDTINYVCCNTKLILPNKYGVLVQFFVTPASQHEFGPQLRSLLESPKIIHYAGYQPWIYCKNKSAHSGLWWKYYNQLGRFPEIRINYFKSIVKYFVRWIMCKTHLMSKDNKYSIYQYYYHPRVSSVYLKKLGF